MKNIFKNKRTLILSIFIISMLSISLGYAYLKSKLSINGNTGIASNSWIIYFDNIIEKEDNIEAVNVATIDENKTKVSFDVDLEKAQDTYEFNVDIVNDGTIDAQIDKVIKSSLTLEQTKKLEYVITYEDGTPIKPCDTLPANSKKNIVVKVRLRQGEEFVNIEDENLSLSFEIDYIQYDENKECDLDDNTYTLTIDPKGGTYKGSANPVVIENLPNGSKIKLDERPIKEEYYFKKWITYNNEDYTTIYEPDIDTITIQGNNAYIEADYKLAVGPYKLYIDPNGGTFRGTTEVTEVDGLLNGKVYYIGSEPELETKLFKGWKEINSDEYTTQYNETNDSITIIDKDAYLQAEYGDAIARVVETNKYYATIEKALLAAEPGQTVELLDDTTENPTNYKKIKRNGNTEPVILDLGGYKVTGKLINNDILTVKNGVFENLDGVGCTNNGILSMGEDDGTVLIDEEGTIAFIGKSTNGGIGLEQRGVFNFYDGYIEGYIGLDGIYNDIPFEHYAFVDHNDDKDCQKVYVIERPDRAVARSVNSNGSIMFYFDLQDAFNSSARSYARGVPLVLEAIRNFEAPNTVGLSEGDKAVFDLVGYTVKIGYTIDNDGDLTFRDSGNATTGEKGELLPSNTLNNLEHGTLRLQDIKITQSTNKNVLENKGDLQIQNSILTAQNAYVIEIKNGNRMEIDATTQLKANNYAILLTNTKPFTIAGGTIEGIRNEGNLILDNWYEKNADGTYNKDSIISPLNITKSANGNIGIYNYAPSNKKVSLTMNGGTLGITNAGEVYGIYNYRENSNSATKIEVSLNNVIMDVTSTDTSTNQIKAIGINGNYSSEITNTIKNSTITIKSSNNANSSIYAGAILTRYGQTTIDGGTYNIINNNPNSNNNGNAILSVYGTTIINNGTINVSGAYATGSSEDNYMTVNDGEVTVTGTKGAYLFSSGSYYSEVNGGKLTSSHVCIYMYDGSKKITGGELICGTNGLIDNGNSPTFTMTGGSITSKKNNINVSYTSSSYGRTINISGGRIISEEGYGIYSNYGKNVITINPSDETTPENYPYIEGATTGIYANNVSTLNIDKAIIIGKTEYGVYTNNTTTFGTNDETISKEYPIIQGSSYGLYINGGTTNIYDGIFKGETWGYYGTVSGLADGGEFIDAVETDVEPNLNVSYVQSQANFVRVKETGIEYNSINKAIAAIEEVGTIEILADHDIKTVTTIPSGKNVTIDFQSHTLSLSKQFINDGILTLNDTTEGTTGGISSIINNTLYNRNSMIIDAGNYRTTSQTLIYNYAPSQKTVTLAINGGKLEVETTGNAYGIYNERANSNSTTKITNNLNNMTMNVTSTDTSSQVRAVGIYSNNSDYITNMISNSNIKVISSNNYSNSINGGSKLTMYGNNTIEGGTYEIINNNPNAINSNSGCAYISVYGNTTINSGTFNVTGAYAYGSGYYNYMTVNGGVINVEGSRDAEIFSSSSYYSEINGGRLTSSHKCIYMSNGDKKITGGELVCGTYGLIDYTNSRTLTMTGGSITSNDNTINFSYSSYARTLNMSGGRIVSENGYGIYSNSSSNVININPSSETIEENYPYIEGSTTGIYLNAVNSAKIDKVVVVGKNGYGVYTNGTTAIGTNEEPISREYPIIQGSTYGLYINSGTTNIYDGIFKGIENGYYGFVSGFADANSLVSGTEDIDGIMYKTNYLDEYEDYVRVKETGIEYNSINKAIAAIEEVGTIEILADHDIKTVTTIPSGKNITIDFQSHTLSLTKQFINDGILTLTDTTEGTTGGISSIINNTLYNRNSMIIDAGNYRTTSQTLIYNYAPSQKTVTLAINGGKLEVETTGNAYGIYNERADSNSTTKITNNLNNMTMNVTSTDTSSQVRAVGIYSNNSDYITNMISNSNIKVISSNNYSNSIHGGSKLTMYGNNTIEGGTYEIINNNPNAINSNSGCAYISVYGNTTINSGTFNVTGAYAYGSGYYNYMTVNGGVINVEGSRDAEIFSSSSYYSEINGGRLTSSHKCIYMSNGDKKITGGELVCGTYGLIDSDWSRTLTMTGGSITSNDNTINFSYSSYARTLNMSGGRIVSESGYGIYSNSSSNVININPSSETIEENYPYIEGAMNGIYMNKGKLTLGNKDGVVNTNHLTVKGGEYGLYLVSGTTNHFYDGKIKGTIYGYNFDTGTINEIEDATYIYEDTEMINETPYIVNYLKSLSPIVKNLRTGDIYNSLQTAFNETKEDDILQLIDDVQLFSSVNIDKNIDNVSVKATLDFNNHEIKSTRAITIQSGANVTMKNGADGTTDRARLYTGVVNVNLILNYGALTMNRINLENTTSSDSSLIITYSGGTSTISNSNMIGIRNINTQSGATTNLNDSTLTASTTAINDEGVTNVNNCNITGTSYGVYSYTTSDGLYIESTITSDSSSFYKYNRNSTQTITDTELLNGYVYNNSGTLNITNGTITSGSKIGNIINNRATTYIKGTTIEDISDKIEQYYYDYYSIDNTSNLTLENVTYSLISSNNGTAIMVRNNGGTFTSLNSTYDLTKTRNSSYNSGHYYGEAVYTYNAGSVISTGNTYTMTDTSGATSPVTRFYGIESTNTSKVISNGDTFDITGGESIYGIYSSSTNKDNILNDATMDLNSNSYVWGFYNVNGDYQTAGNDIIINADTAYGYRIDSGNITMETGEIHATGNNVRGIYLDGTTAVLTLGVEDGSGTPEAEVSITNPLISAIGATTGIGLETNNGTLKYYDGKIIGNTHAKPNTTNVVEKYYEATTYYDAENDYEYCILEYMRTIGNKNNMSASIYDLDYNSDVYYQTIDQALARAKNGETVLMLRSLEQTVTNNSDKDITLDLGNHILKGTITNNGTLRIINGQITTTATSHNKAVINNGTLYIGKNDDNIIYDYVTILGTSIGLENNGIAYMYDGYIRGDTPVYGNSLITRNGYQIVNEPIEETLISGETITYDTVHVTINTSSETIIEGTIYNYEYTGSERIFTAPESGYYKLETWGAQGGSANSTYIGGYGAYSKGFVHLEAGDSLYVNVGGRGIDGDTIGSRLGGYNGGGNVTSNTSRYSVYEGSGGGATHIARVSGLLKNLYNNVSDIIIVAGGGGGAASQGGTDDNYGYGGSGGGYIGVNGHKYDMCTRPDCAGGGTQNEAGLGYSIIKWYSGDYNPVTFGGFGYGGDTENHNDQHGGAGGGGFYGGASSNVNCVKGGSGGSGYIGNELLMTKGLERKVMYGYNVEESSYENTYTISTDEYSEDPEPNKAKIGDGYARITKVTIVEN